MTENGHTTDSNPSAAATDGEVRSETTSTNGVNATSEDDALKRSLAESLGRLQTQNEMLSAPTLTQVGKMCVVQTLVSFKFPLELGDIKGAFLESDDMPKERELYARQPKL